LRQRSVAFKNKSRRNTERTKSGHSRGSPTYSHGPTQHRSTHISQLCSERKETHSRGRPQVARQQQRMRHPAVTFVLYLLSLPAARIGDSQPVLADHPRDLEPNNIKLVTNRMAPAQNTEKAEGRWEPKWCMSLDLEARANQKVCSRGAANSVVQD
jgi:hypothetical protein